MQVQIEAMGEARAKRILQECANTLADMPWEDLTTFEKQLLQRILSDEDYEKLKNAET